MLKQLTYKVRYSLLPLLAILNIAVGLQLVHPYLDHHSLKVDDHLNDSHQHCCSLHSGHQHPVLEQEQQNDNYIHSASEEHQCPICHFLATNQLYPAQPHSIVQLSKSVVQNPPAYSSVSKRYCHSQSEPRAPPLSFS